MRGKHDSDLLHFVQSFIKNWTHKLSYDERGNISKIKMGSTHTLNYEFDPNNQLIFEEIKDKFGYPLVGYGYDGEGLIQSIKLPDRSTILYEYQGPFVKKVSRLAKDKKELYQYQVFSRDLMGNVMEEILPGRAGIRKQTWDQGGRKTGIVTDSFQDVIPEGGYDMLGNIQTRKISFDSEKPETHYEYNALSQLISEKGQIEHHYSYDSLDNRLAKDHSTYRINDLNQLLEAKGATYRFDPNGNLSSKTVNGKTWNFEHNPLNQLSKIKTPDQKTIFFTYDLSGRRLSKKIKEQGKKSQTFRYFYLGGTELGCLDEKGTVVELRIPSDPNQPEKAPFIAFELKNEIYVPIYDLHGNVSCLTDLQSGKVRASYQYTAFGEEGIGLDESPINNPWRYRGNRTDTESGLVLIGCRYYDPEIGRWMNPDSAGDLDGPNLYAYCHNNPLKYVDYFGFASEQPESPVDESYFYGEYEPHCFCERHRDCKRGGDIVMGILTHPRFHGSIQAIGGLAEASAGGWAIFGTGGVAGPIGWPVMAHGLDQFITGMNTTFSGEFTDTTTVQILGLIGISDNWSSFTDSALAILGTMGGSGIIRASKLGTSTKFYSTKTGIVVSNKRISYNFSGAAHKHMHETGRRIPVHILDDIIKSPIAVFKDPQDASGAMMYYSRLWRNGKHYNVEVLYDKANNRILHVQYAPEPIGPLNEIPKPHK